MTALHTQAWFRRQRRIALGLWLAVATASSGCGNSHFYRVAKLPPEYLSPGVENVQTIDLTRLAGHAVSSKQIGPGDLLEVTIETGYADQVDAALARVDDAGHASIPLVGKLPLAGLEPQDAEREIAAAAVARGVYRNPTVTVNIKQLRTSRVTVIGAVENPNAYELPRGSCSLLTALVAAGGLTVNAGTNVEIRRQASAAGQQRPAVDRVTAAGFQQPRAPVQPVSFHVNLMEAARQDGVVHALEDGDIVMVQKRDPQPFDVMGLVTKPGRFEFPANKDVHLLDALAMAGGVSTPWADKAHLIRQVPGQTKPVVIEISIKEAKQQGTGNLRLGPGDVVSVEPTPTTVVTGALRAIAPYSVTAIVPFIR
jgi:polysaccharide export outer membrane protein